VVSYLPSELNTPNGNITKSSFQIMLFGEFITESQRYM